MLEQELLVKLVRALDSNNIPYMLTGSYVSSLQGQPRSTHDIDVIVEIHEEQLAELLEAFPLDEYYRDEESIIDAVKRKDMFNIIEISGGNKIDFWLLTDSPFDRSRFRRRELLDFMQSEIYVSSPEDTILAKLLWSKQSGESRKQFLDALAVYELQGESLDQAYLTEWVKILELEDYWRELVDNAEPVD